jgi:hypothetical protein
MFIDFNSDARQTIYCHDHHRTGTLFIRCSVNEKIRMLEAFDVIVRNTSRLPLTCSNDRQRLSMDDNNNIVCQAPTSFSSACSGRENCTLQMQRTHINTDQQHCQQRLIDYTLAFYECISGTK